MQLAYEALQYGLDCTVGYPSDSFASCLIVSTDDLTRSVQQWPTSTSSATLV